MKHFIDVWRHVTRSKLHSSLTILSMAFSMALMTILYGYLAMQDVAEREAKKYDLAIVLNKIGFAAPLPIAHVDRIRKMDGVTAAIPYAWFGGNYKDEQQPFAQFATDPESAFEVLTDFEIPAEQVAAFKDNRRGCVQPGVNELITSRKMADRFENLGLGEAIEVNNVNFRVVGLFEAGGSSAESEVWADLRDLTAAQRFQGAVSVVNVRVPDDAVRQEVMERVRDDERFKLKAVKETDYFEDQKSSSVAIKVVAYIIAGFLTVGAMFAAANTMYAAVKSRGREIGALRALGYPRRAVLASFLFESLVLCSLGGLLGCLATVPFNGMSGGTQNVATFSEITFSFRFGPPVLLKGMGLAIAMGLIGGLFPAIRAVRLQIVDALGQR